MIVVEAGNVIKFLLLYIQLLRLGTWTTIIYTNHV
jgi:hypothetical protein